MKRHRIAVIAGDGIGPEVIEAAIPVLERVAAKHGFELDLERLPFSADHYLRTKETLPEGAFRHLRDDVDAIFLGALGDPRVPGKMASTSGRYSCCTPILRRCGVSDGRSTSSSFGRTPRASISERAASTANATSRRKSTP